MEELGKFFFTFVGYPEQLMKLYYEFMKSNVPAWGGFWAGVLTIASTILAAVVLHFVFRSLLSRQFFEDLDAELLNYCMLLSVAPGVLLIPLAFIIAIIAACAGLSEGYGEGIVAVVYFSILFIPAFLAIRDAMRSRHRFGMVIVLVGVLAVYASMGLVLYGLMVEFFWSMCVTVGLLIYGKIQSGVECGNVARSPSPRSTPKPAPAPAPRSEKRKEEPAKEAAAVTNEKPKFYSASAEGNYVHVRNEFGHTVSRFRVTNGRILSAQVNGEKVVVQCDDGYTSVYKIKGFLVRKTRNNVKDRSI